MSATIPPACQAVALQTAETITTEVNRALPIVFLIWLSFGLWLGDWTNAWGDEWQLIKRGFTPAGLSYFLARFGGGLGLFSFALTTMVGGTGTLPTSCHVTDKILATFWLICGVGAQGTFMLRCIAVWENARRIKLFLSVLLAIIAGTFVIFIVVIDGLKTELGLLVCTIKTPSRLEAIATISTMVIDVIVIGLTAYKLLGSRTQNEGRIRHLLFRDGVIYLAIVVAVSATITVMLLTDLPPVQRVVLSPIHIVSLSLAATRAQRALRAEGVKLASMSKGSATAATEAHRRLSSNSDQATTALPPSTPLTPVTPRFYDAAASPRFSTNTKEGDASWQTSRRAANKIVLESFAMQPPPLPPNARYQTQHHQEQTHPQQSPSSPRSPRSPYGMPTSWSYAPGATEEMSERREDEEAARDTRP